MDVVLHYLVEGLSVLIIGFITVAYMVVGGYEQGVILGGIGAITAIAAWDIHKREQNKP